ncbi:hypothetical protein OE88DRAFT_1733721 [Heliocybe sulcata]|uniref:Fungal-type protein kinase domain-containing protein n=1 Tax=Heliocybe sulcata TaxID=5364 RepID=A0A5C3N9S0_9AGAM|nr:hypothetical protein OE88DRAFT_1733721 [Heliocybe sulcata]
MLTTPKPTRGQTGEYNSSPYFRPIDGRRTSSSRGGMLERELFYRARLGSTFAREFETLWGEVDKACERKSEELMYPPMRTALQYACDVLADMKLPAFRVDYASQQRLTGEAPVGPGLALQLKDSSEMHWTRALVTVEAKPDVEQDPFKHDKAEPSSFITWNHFCESSALVLRARPRCYLLGLGAYGDTLRFWRCDQSSVMFTEAFEYMAQPELVLEFLYASSVFSGGTMGLDTTVAPGAYDVGDLEILASSCRFASASGILGKNMNLRAVDLLSESAVISVPMCDVDDRLSGNYSPGGDVQVVPNTAKSGASEEETVERYISVGPALFTSPSLFGRGTRTWLAVRASVLNSERGRVELADFVVIKETWRHADRLPESAIYAKVHAAGPVFGVARARRGVDLDKGEPQSTHLTWAERLNKFYGKEQYSLRIHQRIVIESIGIPLSQFRSSRELVEATRDAMKGE